MAPFLNLLGGYDVPMLEIWLSRVRVPYLALGVAIFSALVYAIALRNGFVSLDDGLLIYKNPAVQRLSWPTLRYIFTSYDPELYIPLTLFSYQLNHVVGGLEPMIYHLTNIFLHAGNAALVLFIAERLTKNRLAALLCALLFAIHPINTEAVVWAAARKDVLSGYFFLLSLLTYMRHRDTEDARMWWISIFGFLLGLLSKVSIITLPLILLLYDWKERRAWTKEMLADKVPYLLLAVLFGIIAIIGKTRVLQSSGLRLNILLAAKSTMFYLWKMIAPFGFSVIYPQPQPLTFFQTDIMISVTGVIFLSAVLLYLLWQGKNRLAAFALGSFFLLLLPNYTNFLKNGFLFFASDRYAYLPSILIFLLIGLLVARVSRAHRSASLIGIIALIVPLSAFAILQSKTWYSSETLYRNVIHWYPDSEVAHNNLGDILTKSGRKEEAMPEFDRALAINPNLMSAHVNKGNAYRENAEFEKALEEYRAAVKASALTPKPLSFDDVAAYYYLGQLLEQLGKSEEALDQFRQATIEAANLAEPHYNYGLMLQKAGRTDDALEEFTAAVSLDPLYIAAQYHLAGMLSERGKLAEARAALRQVVAVDPTYAKAAEHLRAIETLMQAERGSQ